MFYCCLTISGSQEKREVAVKVLRQDSEVSFLSSSLASSWCLFPRVLWVTVIS